MKGELQVHEHTQHQGINSTNCFASLHDDAGNPYVPIVVLPARTASCDAICLSGEPVPQLVLVHVHCYPAKWMNERINAPDLPECPGLMKCLHRDRLKDRSRPLWIPCDHTTDSSGESFVLERCVFLYTPATNLQNLLSNQHAMIPACALQVRRERGTEAQPFSSAAIRHILFPVAKTLACLHRAGLPHNNVRPENIVITPDLTVYLHGLDALPNTLCEHVRYRSPELAKLKGLPAVHNMLAGDVWAFGCVLLYMATQRKPFCDEEDSLTILSELQLLNSNWRHLALQPPCLEDRVEKVLELSKDVQIRQLARLCLTVDSNERATIHDVLAHPFFNGAAEQYVPTTYGALICSTRANTVDNVVGVESFESLVKGVTDIFSEESLGLACVAIMAKNAVLHSVLLPLLEEEKSGSASAGMSASSSECDAFAGFNPVPALGSNEPLVAQPVVEILQEFPTPCALNFSTDALSSTCDRELYLQCLQHAIQMVQQAPQNSFQWSSEEGKDSAPLSTGLSPSTTLNSIHVGADCIFASDDDASGNESHVDFREDDEESNAIESGVFTLQGSDTVCTQVLNDGADEQKVNCILRDVEAMRARSRSNDCLLRRKLLVVSTAMLFFVVVAAIVLGVMLSRH